MKKIFGLIWLAFSCQHVVAQFMSNNNAFISIKDKAMVSVLGDIYNLKSGHFNNSDTIYLTGNWTNNASNHAFDSIDAGYVYFWANADQIIKGTSETYFYNLILKNGGIKYADIDAKVDGFLDLTDREFSVDTNTIWVRNPLLNAVRRTSGFLSSLEDGGLLRHTNQSGIYLFPVGSSRIFTRYRPIEITPNSAAFNIYKARFANTDATSEGFDREQRFHLLCQINPYWYHRLYHPTGSDSAKLNFFFDPAADGNWNELAHWENRPEWEPMVHDQLINGTPFTSISKNNWNNFNSKAFALAIYNPPFAQAGVDTLIWKYDTIQLQASGGFDYTWTPAQTLSCNDCSQPMAFPLTSTIYYLTVKNELGCVDYDSLYLLVKDKPFSLLDIPNVITPNGDGYNDVWHIGALDRYPDNEVRIINRWGSEVFYQKNYQQNWAGTYKNDPSPGGSYYYIIKIKNNAGEVASFDGPITILR